MTYVDQPDKKQKHPHYEHRTEKLNRKNHEFTSKKFHEVRKVSTHKKLLKSFGRIGMSLNVKTPSDIPVGDLDKVCFILINDYEDDDKELGVGPLNDGYLLGLKHHRHGFKVFYLYNPSTNEFTNFLSFFLLNTQHALTVFYTGRNLNGSQGIEFKNDSITKDTLGNIIASSCNDKCHVVFICDCQGSGTVFDISQAGNNGSHAQLVSFFVDKTSDPESKESKRSHGIFTYYFCKITSDCPDITPNRLFERMKPSLHRFGEVFRCEVSEEKIADSPIFFN